MNNRKTIAIIGAGFIGLNLIRQLLLMNVNIRVLDHNACPEEFQDKLLWISASFGDKSAVKELLNSNIDVAYHMVSSTVPGNDTDKKIIDELYENVFTSIEFIQVCLETKVKRIVFLSSSSVYGIQDRFPILESALTNPISAHGIQKLTLEKYFYLFQFIKEIEVKIVRLSNPYGPGQNINGRQGFIAIAIGALINNIPLLIRDDGRTIRDYIYIDDVIVALKKVGLNQKVPSLLNIGSGIQYSLTEVLQIIENYTGKAINVSYGEKRKIDIPKSVLDVQLAKKEIDFIAEVSLNVGILKTLQYHNLLE